MVNNTIKLKTTLRAYSRVPFYDDYIRIPSEKTLPGSYDASAYYLVQGGEWINLFNAFNIGSMETTFLNGVINDAMENYEIIPYSIDSNNGGEL